MKVIISQPMAGKTKEQIMEERKELIDLLKKEGHEVLDTVFDTAPKDKNGALYFLSKSIEILSEADGVVFMPGWNNARGCIIENQVATAYGKFIRYI